MTEPQKMGVDAIWRLICAHDFSRKNESQQIAAFAEKQLLDALTTIIEERDRWRQHHKELVNDFLPGFLGCLPSCDSYGHSEDCPAVEPLAAQKALLADRDALALRVKMLEGAVTQIWPDIGSIGPAAIYCRFCDAKAEWIQVPTGLEHPPLSEVQHAPDCIVRTINTQP